MATHDDFPVIVNDGDQLNDGYFTGLAGEILANVLRCYRETSPTGNVSNDLAFESDIASSQYNTLDQATVTTTNGWFDSGLGLYFFGYNYDDYNSAVDATKWTGAGTGSNSETTSYIQRQATHASNTSARDTSLEAKGSSDSMNVYPASGTTTEGCIKIILTAAHATSDANKTCTWYITDGSTEIVVDQSNATQIGNVTLNDTYYYVVDSSADTITTYTAYGGSANQVDISTLTGTEWYFKFKSEIAAGATSATTTLTVQVYSMVYVNGSGGVTIPTSDMETTATTTNSSNSFAIGAYYGEGVTMSLTTNGGTNYSTATNKIVTSTTAGTSFQIKMEPSSTQPNALPKFDELAGMSLE